MPETSTRYHCRHIHLSGHRCGSPALRDESFCYYHHTTRKPAARHKPHFQIPNLEDRSALQHSITEVLNRISQGLLDPKTAGLLLYGLQIAANNLPRPSANEPTTQTIEILELTDQNEPLAPTQLFLNPPHEKTLEEILVEQWELDKHNAALQQAEQAARRAAESI